MTETHNHTASGSVPNALQRGKACLRCRKRKMRCDGAKPACQQCLRNKKGDMCEYDDGKGKTRTQLLREHIARLEQRIHELEDPEHAAPAITLFDPHAMFDDGSSTSASSSPTSLPVTASSGSTAERPNTPFSVFTNFVGSPSPIPFGENGLLEEPETPIALSVALLDIFLPHASQLGIGVCHDRLRDSLALSPSEQRHPVLMNAIYLWACFLSRPGPLSEHESNYLRRTLQALPDALQDPTRVVDTVIAGCLLAMYYLTTGRVLEGRYHLSAAAAIATQMGLHTHPADDAGRWDPLVPGQLGLPQDLVEEGERALAFWLVYNLDRCWSVTLQTPSTIPRDIDPSFSIDIAWPQSIEEYQSGVIPDMTSVDTVRTFLTGQAAYGGYSMPALRSKASALYAYAHRLSTSLDDSLRNVGALSPPVQQQFLGFEALVARFVSTLLPVNQLDATAPETRQSLLAVHTLAHAAVIRLNFRFDDNSAVAHDKCLRAARACVAVVKHVGEADYAFLDPILASCWLEVTEVLCRETTWLESAWPMANSSEVRTELGMVVYATSVLGQTFPIANAIAAKMQSMLASL